MSTRNRNRQGGGNDNLAYPPVSKDKDSTPIVSDGFAATLTVIFIAIEVLMAVLGLFPWDVLSAESSETATTIINTILFLLPFVGIFLVKNVKDRG